MDEIDEATAADVERHAEACRKCAAIIGNHPAHKPLVDQVRDMAESRKALGPALERLKVIEKHPFTNVLGDDCRDPRLT